MSSMVPILYSCEGLQCAMGKPRNPDTTVYIYIYIYIQCKYICTYIYVRSIYSMTPRIVALKLYRQLFLVPAVVSHL